MGARRQTAANGRPCRQTLPACARAPGRPLPTADVCVRLCGHCRLRTCAPAPVRTLLTGVRRQTAADGRPCRDTCRRVRARLCRHCRRARRQTGARAGSPCRRARAPVRSQPTCARVPVRTLPTGARAHVRSLPTCERAGRRQQTGARAGSPCHARLCGHYRLPTCARARLCSHFRPVRAQADGRPCRQPLPRAPVRTLPTADVHARACAVTADLCARRQTGARAGSVAKYVE
ncbi:UNVERIFIED_CONTAM: hypothetical protein Sindi_1172300 [Sesamum indicum]